MYWQDACMSVYFIDEKYTGGQGTVENIFKVRAIWIRAELNSLMKSRKNLSQGFLRCWRFFLLLNLTLLLDSRHNSDL